MTVNYVHWIRSFVGHQRLLQLSASAFIQDEQGKVLLGRRSDVMLWAPPSGVVQLEETPAQTLVREVREETGLIVKPTRLIGLYSGPDFDWTYPNGDQAKIICSFFACQITGGELKADYREFLDLKFFDSANLPALMPRYARIVRDALEGKQEASFD